jgi:hypothetical protein
MKLKNLVLSADDLCKIIEKCSTSGVKDFKFGDMSLSFTGFKGWEVPSVEIQDIVAPRSERTDTINVSTTQDELEAKEEMLQQMLIEDPLQYEKLLVQGEFNAE